MTTRTIEPLNFNGETIYIEVSEVEQETEDGYEETSAAEKMAEAGDRVRSTISALAGSVGKALNGVDGPEEWTIEVNLGFNGKAGIPFVTEGGVNGAVKVTAKWKRSS